MSKPSETAATIQDLCEELIHISETDADVNIFVVGRNVADLTATNFRAANYLLPDAVIETIDFEDFIGAQGNVQWLALGVFMQGQLEQLKVFKTNGVRREIFAVGLYNGIIMGVRTFAVET